MINLKLKLRKNLFFQSLKMDLVDSQYYHEAWLENPEGSEKRARWIKWLDEWGFIKALNN